MKIENIIRRVLRDQEEKLSELPPFDDFFDNDWNLVLNLMGIYPNKKFYYPGDLDLRYTKIETLGNLVRVDGDLDLNFCRNLQSLGSLEYVGGDLSLYFCENLESLGNLNYVGESLYLDADYIKTLESLGDLQYVGNRLYWEGCDYDTKEVEEVVWVRAHLYL